MRKLLVWVAILSLATFGFSKATYAEGVPVDNYASLKTSATSGGEVELTADIELASNIFVKNPLTIDLNGHTITASSSSKRLIITSELTVKDSSADQNGKITGSGNYYLRVGNGADAPGTLILESGKIESNSSYDILIGAGEMIMNGGTISSSNVPVLANGGDFTMNDGLITTNGTAVRGNKPESLITLNGGKIESTGDSLTVNLSGGSKMVMNDGLIEALNMGSRPGTGGVGVIVYRDGEFTMNGGKIDSASSSIMSNGSNEDWNNSAGVNAKFTITGGELNSTKHSAIYAPQYQGATLITGGKIIGHDSAIELRGGSLTIEGGEFRATSEEFSIENNTSGTTTKGAAIAVIQHTTVDNMKVHICNGRFYGIVPLVEANPNNNSAEDIAKISLLIDNSCGQPNFYATGDAVIMSEDFTGFVKGGRYSSHVTDFVADGFGEKDEDDMIAVYEWHDVIVNDPQYGEVSTSKIRAMSGDAINISTTPLENAELLSLEARDEENNLIEISDSAAIMPDAKLTIRARFARAVTNDIDVGDSDITRSIMVESLRADEDLMSSVGDSDPLIELTINNTDNDEEALKQLPEGDSVLVGTRNIRVDVSAGGEKIGELNSLLGDIEIGIALPDTIEPVIEGYERNFYLIGNNEVIKANSVENNVASFKIGATGKYSVAYVDKQINSDNVESPNTSDNIAKSILIVAGCAALLAVPLARKRR